MEILKVEDLSFSYAGAGSPSLDGVSFSARAGEIIAVCGASGSGKSTLLRMIKRELIPEGERSGDVFICGARQSDLTPRDAAADVGFVFQSPEMQIVCDKVWHELAFGLENLGTEQSVIRRRVAETASYFGIGGIFDKRTDELSGGQKQLVALASVCVMSPKIILLDEPTSRLDPIASLEFVSMLRRLSRELGMTVIIAEHTLGGIIDMCDRLIALDGGKIIADGTPRDSIKSLAKTPLIYTLPAPARVFISTHGEGECPLGVSEGRVYIENNFKNEIRALPRSNKSGTGGAALEMKDVFFRYDRRGDDVLRGMSLRVLEGEILSILGANGSGKSTALSVISGIRRAYSGRVRIFGKDISEYKNQTLYRGCLSMLPQDVQTVFLKNTVYEELCDVGGKDFELPFDISHLYKKHPYDLSGGEQQLAALAKVLLTKPRLLLLDEPTKGLDGATKRRLKTIISSLKDGGTTTVIVTHDTDFAADISDRCALVFSGEVICCDDVDKFFFESEFYTTETSRMTRGYYDGAVRVDDVLRLAEINGRRK